MNKLNKIAFASLVAISGGVMAQSADLAPGEYVVDNKVFVDVTYTTPAVSIQVSNKDGVAAKAGYFIDKPVYGYVGYLGNVQSNTPEGVLRQITETIGVDKTFKDHDGNTIVTVTLPNGINAVVPTLTKAQIDALIAADIVAQTPTGTTTKEWVPPVAEVPETFRTETIPGTSYTEQQFVRVYATGTWTQVAKDFSVQEKEGYTYRRHNRELTVTSNFTSYSVQCLGGNMICAGKAPEALATVKNSDDREARQAEARAQIDGQIRQETRHAVRDAVAVNVLAEQIINPMISEVGSVGASVGGNADQPKTVIGFSTKANEDGVSLSINSAGTVGINKVVFEEGIVKMTAGVSATNGHLAVGPAVTIAKDGYGVGLSTFGPSIVVAGTSISIVPQLAVANMCVVVLSKGINAIINMFKADRQEMVAKSEE